ncbi:oxygen-independent coproporphyrinogen III oxidase [Prosthecomicrobium sp. N25]|uniref:oxygen-independent coproporphyrinogen III oxidase n=1 Tax=Prosthecomicrobium sp. N25 TaxID=3129254 RepID=UPI00307767BF
MNTTLQARYAARTVPRYTSYPTAPHFSDAIGPDDYAAWLRALPGDGPVSLYLHVPYCRAICHYCGCHTKAALRDEPVIDYAERLIAEIGLVADTAGRRLPVAHVHWGGGTPSLLPAASFLKIVAALRERFDWLPDAEHAIELDPRTVTPALAATLAAAGVTRASLGVQDFDRTVQEAIGRIQPFETVERAVAALRGVGITAINFDLMYGLPHQTAETIRTTVALAQSLEPSRIALFGYAHVPWFKKHQRLIDEAALPGASERIQLEQVARDALAATGFQAIGLDHFARPDDAMAVADRAGALRRNFQGYTTDTADTLIGLGASSIGRMPQGFVQNDPDVGRWGRAIAAGRLPVVKGKALDADDRLRGAIIERLMCDYRVDLAAVTAAFGETPAAVADGTERLAELVRDGLVRLDGPVVSVTEGGRPFVRLAAAAFDAYLARAAARHSMAV